MKTKKLGKWLENYWYHYKWQTLIALFLIVVAAVCIGQMVTRTDPDVSVIYGGPCELTANQIHEVDLALSSLLPEDYNRDGERSAELVHFLLMTDDQRKALLEQAAQESRPLVINTKNLEQNRTNFTTQIAVGDASICFLDPVWYETVRENNGFVTLESILGFRPDGALDDYSVRLCDLPFAQYFDAFSVFPDDTVLAFRQKSITGGAGSGELYEHAAAMFRSLMAWRG